MNLVDIDGGCVAYGLDRVEPASCFISDLGDPTGMTGGRIGRELQPQWEPHGACRAVRTFLAEAAAEEDLDSDGLSFVYAVRVVSSRGLRHPRGAKREMGNYPIRRVGPLDHRRHAWIPLLLAPACPMGNIGVGM